MGRDAVDLEPEELAVIHYAAGSAEKVKIDELEQERNALELAFQVPGFSRYALGGGV